jgi:hypothetical protein
MVMTSRGRAHAYWLLVKPLPVEEYKPIARAMAKKLNADPSGACLKPTRPPGSINRKARHNEYRAKLKINVGTIYAADRLRVTFGATQASTEPSDAECNAMWNAIQNDIAGIDTNPGGAYVNEHGIPRRIARSGNKTAIEARRILKNARNGEMTYLHPSGTWDASRERYRVVYALIAHGAPDAEAAAIARAVANFGENAKGAASVEVDTMRCVSKIRQGMTGVEITPMRSNSRHSKGHSEPGRTWASVADFAARAPEPAPAAAKRGRPAAYTLTEDDLVQWLRDNGHGASSTVFGTRKEHAEQLGVSVSHLCKIERSLKQQERAERRTKRHESWLQLIDFRVFKNTEADDFRVFKNHGETEEAEHDATCTLPVTEPNGDEFRVFKNDLNATAEPEAPALPIATVENDAETAHEEPAQSEAQQSAELSVAIAENGGEACNARNAPGISHIPTTLRFAECDIHNQETARSETNSTLRLREPASVIERRERKVRLAKLSHAELEQRRHDLLQQARQARKPWERKELEAQVQEVSDELGTRRDQGIEAMFAQAGRPEGEKQQAEPAPAKRATLPAPRQQGEAEHDFALVAATALPAEETRRHIADARRIALPRTSEAAYAHLRRKLHGKASIEALRAWVEAEKARKLALPDWVDVIIG